MRICICVSIELCTITSYITQYQIRIQIQLAAGEQRTKGRMVFKLLVISHSSLYGLRCEQDMDTSCIFCGYDLCLLAVLMLGRCQDF